ncbi:unnamed protein product [Blepharisma stoltei]|uniref:Uncharacterized protein n=1 Tax=Blepharisma stoltei TaxID=1481888 RepID=A0AAU9JCF2_9CILI|nr:unnamed protein product [Blepharisma stoltei]
MQTSYVYGQRKNFIISFDEDNPPDLTLNSEKNELSPMPSYYSSLPPISSNKSFIRQKKKPMHSKKELKKANKIKYITKKLYDQEMEKRHQRSNSYNGMNYQDEHIKDEIIRLRQNKSKTKDQNSNVSSIYNISMSMINRRNFGFNENLHRKQSSMPLFLISPMDIENPIFHNENPGIKDQKLDTQAYELNKLRQAMANIITKEEEDLHSWKEPESKKSNFLLDLKPIFRRLISIVMKAKIHNELKEPEKRKLIEQYKNHLKESDDKIKVIIGTLSILEENLKDSKIQFHDLKIEMLNKKIEQYKEALKIFQITREKLKDAIKLFKANFRKEAQQKTFNVFNFTNEYDDVNITVNNPEKKKTDTKQEENKFRRGKISLADFMKM